MTVKRSTNSWWRLSLAGAAALLLAVTGSTPAFAASATFSAWAAAMEGFSRLQVAVTIDYPLQFGCQAWIYAGAAHPRVTIDWVTCDQAKYSWDGTSVRYDAARAPVVTRPELDGVVAGVWSEVRSGFVRSTVTSVDQDALGLVGFRGDWSKIVLPFEWASPYSIYVDVENASKSLAALQVFKGEKRVFDLTVQRVLVDPTIAAEHLGPNAGAGGLSVEENWGGCVY